MRIISVDWTRPQFVNAALFFAFLHRMNQEFILTGDPDGAVFSAGIVHAVMLRNVFLEANAFQIEPSIPFLTPYMPPRKNGERANTGDSFKGRQFPGAAEHAPAGRYRMD